MSTSGTRWRILSAVRVGAGEIVVVVLDVMVAMMLVCLTYAIVCCGF